MLRLLLGTLVAVILLYAAAAASGGQSPDQVKSAEEPSAEQAAATKPANAAEEEGVEEAPEALPPGDTRTRQAVVDLIQTVGPTLPDWWDSVPLDYPETLNLQWVQVKDDWGPDHNLGAYMYTRITEHPDKWRAGIKLLHHCLDVNKENPTALQKTREALADKYRFFLLDHARAAYWILQAGNSDPVLLAECCWKLGSKSLAVEILSKLRPGGHLDAKAMKLWGEMGELKRALVLAEWLVRSRQPDLAYLNAGDAARVAGRFQEALTYYRSAVAVQQGGRYARPNKERARASADAVEAFAGVDLSAIPDGTYSGTSKGGYKGPVEVEVTVKDGRIESVVVTRHQENWYGASAQYVPAKIVEQQGIKGVDAVTGATMTSRAIINATMNALAGAAG